MKKIYIEILNKLITVDDNYVNVISFMDSKIYKEFFFNILDHISYSVDNKIVDMEKSSVIVYNPFQISLSDKKIITALYKQIEKRLNNEEKQIINHIEQQGFELLNLFNVDLNYELEYSEQMDIQKFLSAFSLTFSYDLKGNYLKSLCQYFNVCCDFLNTKIIISFGLLNLLDGDEIELLNKELQQLDLLLLDIQYLNQFSRNALIVDKDWYII